MAKQRKRNAIFDSEDGSDSDDYSQEGDVTVGRPKLAFSDADKSKRLEWLRRKNADYQKRFRAKMKLDPTKYERQLAAKRRLTNSCKARKYGDWTALFPIKAKALALLEEANRDFLRQQTAVRHPQEEWEIWSNRAHFQLLLKLRKNSSNYSSARKRNSSHWLSWLANTLDRMMRFKIYAIHWRLVTMPKRQTDKSRSLSNAQRGRAITRARW